MVRWASFFRTGIIALAAVWAAFALATEGKPLSAFAQDTWTTRDGLPHNQVNDIAQTPDGYLWLATWEGLVRYNGQDFVVMGPSAIPELREFGIRSVTVGPAGELVVATARAGVAVQRQGTWRAYSTDDGLSQNASMKAVVDGRGQLWVAHASRGLSRVGTDGQARRFRASDGLAADQLYDVQVDRNGVAWVGTSRGLSRIEGDRVQSFGLADGLPEGAIYAIRFEKDGGLLLGTHHGVYRGLNGRFWPHEAGFPDEAVASLAMEPNGTLVAGTVNLGLVRAGERGIEIFDRPRGLPNNRVPALFVDREGSIWAGTNAGLLRFSDTPFASYDARAGLSDDYVRAVLELDDGRVLIGTSEGLDVWQNGQLWSFGGRLGLPRQAILSLAQSRDGSIWVGTYSDGLLQIRDDRVIRRLGEADGLAGLQVRAIEESRDGQLWIGTSTGLYRMATPLANPQRVASSADVPLNFILSLHEAPDGTLWVGTAAGLIRRIAERFEVIDISAFDAQDVFHFTDDPEGGLWISTSRGVLRWKNNLLAGVSSKQGLPVAATFATVIDRYGNFWITSNRGVVHVRRDAMRATVDSGAPLAFLRFGEPDGMASAQCNGGAGPAAIRTADGAIWVATARGVSFVQPDELPRFQRLPPPVILESVRLDGRRQAARDVLKVAPEQSRIDLEFASLSYRMTEQIRYRYRLEGLDRDWTDSGTIRSARFSHLPAGEYVFEVAAGIDGGGWNPQSTRLALVIEPPFWRRPVFLMLCGLLTAMLLYWIYALRLSVLRHRERELSHLVELRTRDLAEKNLELSRMAETVRRQSLSFERQARTDALTDLPNRRNMEEQLATAFNDAQRRSQPLCFALLDMDHFKTVNDRWSHEAGDELLRQVAVLMRECLHSEDRIARWGGEEFAILFADKTLAEAKVEADRLRRRIEALDCEAFAPGLRATASIGIADAQGLPSFGKLVTLADERLYAAKHAGRNRVET